MPRRERDNNPRQITSEKQIPPRDNFTPVSQAEGSIKSFDGFEDLPQEQQEAVVHYAGTTAYYFGLRVHARVFPNFEDRRLLSRGFITPNTLISEQEQLKGNGVPERFIKAADLIGQTIAIEMVAERAEQAIQNSQYLFQRRAS